MHQFFKFRSKKIGLTLLPFQASYTRFAMRESHKALYLLSYFTHFYTHAGAESKTWNLWLFISLSFEDSLSLSLSHTHTHTSNPKWKSTLIFYFDFDFGGSLTLILLLRVLKRKRGVDNWNLVWFECGILFYKCVFFLFSFFVKVVGFGNVFLLVFVNCRRKGKSYNTPRIYR